MKYSASHINSITVELTSQEIEQAVRHGMAMRKVSIQKQHKNHKGYNPDDKKAMRVQCLGALAEAIACKALEIPIALTNETFNVEDLPGGIQVRLIGAEHYGLRVYLKDDPNWKVIGVVIPPGKERSGSYRVAGWCLASEAQGKLEWEMAPCNRPPMYCVPQNCLRSVSELRQITNQPKPCCQKHTN